MKPVLVLLAIQLSFVAGAVVVGCTAAQKAQFATAMTGVPATQPSDLPTTPTGNSVENITSKVGQGAAAVAAIPGPWSGYAAILAGIASGLLALERVAAAFGLNLPNSKSSQSLSSSASAGGTSSSTNPPSGLQPLRPAA